MAMLNERVETLPREELKKLQSERLIWQVKRTYERVECFRNRMDELGLKPEDIKGVEDLHKLPFSYKKDLRDYYPYGLFADPLKNITRIHASSGTTGKRIVVGTKQLKKAVLNGRVDCVFLAENADPIVTQPLEVLCESKNIPIRWVCSMADLGRACGIEVGAAAAAVLNF